MTLLQHSFIYLWTHNTKRKYYRKEKILFRKLLSSITQKKKEYRNISHNWTHISTGRSSLTLKSFMYRPTMLFLSLPLYAFNTKNRRELYPLTDLLDMGIFVIFVEGNKSERFTNQENCLVLHPQVVKIFSYVNNNWSFLGFILTMVSVSNIIPW